MVEVYATVGRDLIRELELLFRTVHIAAVYERDAETIVTKTGARRPFDAGGE